MALLSAAGTSSTSVLVTLAPGSSQSADASQYTLMTEGGNKIAVNAVFPLPGGQRVVLTTALQPAGNATIRLATGAAVTFKVSETAAPVLKDATALNSKQLLLRFATPDGSPATLLDSAIQPTLYEVPGLKVTGAAFSTDRAAVVLTTETQSDVAYPVRVTGVVSSTYAVASGASSVQGIATTDTRAPRVLAANALDRQSIVVAFDEPIGDVVPADFVVTSDAGVSLETRAVTFTDEFRTAVRLSTAQQQDGVYTVKVKNVTDAAQNVVDATGGQVTVNNAANADTTPPRLSSVGATNSTTIIVTFSEPMKGGTTGAENPANYQITGTASSQPSGTAQPGTPLLAPPVQMVPGADGTGNSLKGAVNTAVATAGTLKPDGLRPQNATLVITRAKLLPGGTAVELTTLQQSNVDYQLQVTNVTDLAGNQIAPPSQATNPSVFTFVGKVASGAGVDTDKDGVSDAEEQRGWVVKVTRQDGTSFTREVTSDPTLADTDGDGLSDRDERTYLTDPRVADTDADQLSDTVELSDTYSTPTDQDTDNDGISDGLEVSLYNTSPLLPDTDGDQIADGKEVLLDNRNPRVADLPVPGLSVGNVDLRLTEQFTATSGQNTRTLESRTASSTLTQNQSVSNSTSQASTVEFFAKVGANLGFEAGTDGAKVIGGVNAEAGLTASATASFTNESARASQQEYQNSLTTDKEVARDETVTRQVTGATMAVAVSLKALGSVAFTIKNLEVTALMQDPYDPTQFVPIATLLPESGAGNGINVGPLQADRGPFRFSTDKASPALVEALMRNPKGLFFKIANYDITDELGRNFAFTSQDINDRTLELGIDYAGLRPLELNRVATSSTFDAAGASRGVTVQEMLEGSMHLKHYDKAQDAGLSQDQLINSYSTYVVGGVERLWRVRDIAQSATEAKKKWFFITKTGIDESLNFGATRLKAGSVVRLAFAQDLDGDGLTLAQESLYPSFDNPTTGIDSDKDGVKDNDEVNGLKVGNIRKAWTIEFNDAQSGYQTSSNPGRADTDLDGLTDCQELALCDYTDRAGAKHRLKKITDPANPDTDGDGIRDSDELFGYDVVSVTNKKVFMAISDPLSRDSDNDGLSDSREQRVGTNPSIADADNVLDNDGDGLVNIEETTPHQIAYVSLNGASVTGNVTSDINNPDTDGDGLNDAQELSAGTNPRAADTDGDGLSDTQELKGSAFGTDTTNPLRKTNPLRTDTDGDGLSDGQEINQPWTVSSDDISPYKVYADPLVADTDFDNLNDKQEFELKSDPRKADTDGDGTFDAGEVQRGTKILIKDYLVTVTWKSFTPGSANLNADCDDGANPGEFLYAFQVVLPDAIDRTDVATPITYATYGPTVLEGNNRVVQANANQTILLQDSISFPLAFSKTFTLQGVVQEMDGNFADTRMEFYFGGIAAPVGNFNGSTIQKGTQDILFSKTTTPCTMYVSASVNVR